MLQSHLKLVFIENADVDDRYTYFISLDQFGFLRKSIEVYFVSILEITSSNHWMVESLTICKRNGNIKKS